MKKFEKITNNERFDITDNFLILACDVSLDTINLYTETAVGVIERIFDNNTDAIEKELRQFDLFVSGGKFKAAAVVCEPTGIYHDTLFRIARRLGFYTAYVSAEAVAKMRVIETNDSGKTDTKDPRVIYTLARIGKTLHHRIFDEPYSLLRKWNGIYDSADRGVVSAKCAIHTLIKTIFPDYGMKKDFTLGKSGRAMMRLYGFDPHRIVSAGETTFGNQMKSLCPRIHNSSLDDIFTQARNSLKRGLNGRELNLLSLELGLRWEDLDRHLDRKAQARDEMETLYLEAQKLDTNLPDEKKGVINTFHLSRIIAETGPLSDFPNWRKLMRFSGLNLREKQSGKFRGKTKISKKGRPLFRKVLKLSVLTLTKRKGIYHEYYRKKRDDDKMPGTKAMTVIARHFLKMIFGVYKSGSQFDKERIFVCESQFTKAA